MLDLNEVEILQVAMAHEERARVFYARLARSHDDTPAGDLFDYLAGEEEGHIRKLSARHGMARFEAGWDEKYLPYLIDLDRLAWEDGIAAGAAAGKDALVKGLGIARKAEQHAIDFYRRAGEIVEEKDTKDLLSELGEEERLHLAKIEEHLGNL